MAQKKRVSDSQSENASVPSNHHSEDKSDKFWRILDALLALEVSEGHLKWSFQQLSRTAKVHRTSIYYYFGKSKEAILHQALKTIGESFFGFTDDRLSYWRDNRISEAIQHTRDMVAKAPHLVEFYFHWRRKPHSVIAKELLALEERYFDKVRAFYPQLTQDQAKSLFGFFFGLSLSPYLTQDDLDCLCSAALSRHKP